MRKKEARLIYREKRNALSHTEKSKLDDLLLIQFQKMSLPPLHAVLSYWPMADAKEPDTHLFSDYLEFKYPGLQMLYPRTNFDTLEMYAIAVEEQTRFSKNRYDIYEPETGDIVSPGEIDLVMVPLLAVDTKGCRVGYGKGFYDRFLPACRKDCIKAGFTYFDPVEKIEDAGEFDVPLNLCITPHMIYDF